MILAQNKKAKWDAKKHLSFENTVDGRLTYAEFQADLEKKLTPIGLDKTLRCLPNSYPVRPVSANWQKYLTPPMSFLQ
jgi:hypothetical protein